MAESSWLYDDRPNVRRFRDTRTGRFLPTDTAVDLRDGFQERRRADVEALTRRLADQSISIQDWEREMTTALRQLHTAQFVYGRGGLNAMTPTDWTTATALVEEQRQFLRAFAEDIAAGRLSEAQINARAKLYYGASVGSYERGRASAFNVTLPAYPCDGATPCKAACRCRWSLVETAEEIRATWQLRSGESCSGCKSRAARWAPLVIAKSSDGRSARLWRSVA